MKSLESGDAVVLDELNYLEDRREEFASKIWFVVEKL